MSAPKVSIVTPVFDGGAWLRQAIDSIRRQSLTDFEFIIVDDGSTDQGGLVIADAARDDSRIRAVQQAHLGVSVALNHGIALARSQFIARMDADDIAHPERLQMQLTFLEKNPGVAAAGSWANLIDEQGRKIGDFRPDSEPAALHDLLAKQNPFIHSSMMMSTDLVRRLGGYRAVLEGAEDYDLWLRMSEHAQLANLPEFLLSYRRHLGSASAAANVKQLLAARLARMSAADRRASQPDFADRLHAPLDLSALGERDGLRAAAGVYRLIGRSPAEPIGARELAHLGRADLTHAERKAAQIWLTQLFKRDESFLIRSQALFWLIYLHPARALSLIWTARKG